MSGLSVVSASAGSGKTHKITLEFLKLLYKDTDNFRHILAVTFTNKATEEMKSRIIRELNNLSANRNSEYLDYIIKQTGMSEKQVRLKSDIILKKILHNYSRFAVSTIDSFFQKIIRAFTREIGIQSGFTIEMDEENVLDKSIDRLFIDIENNPALKNWLIHFAKNRIEEGRGWNFKKDILELGREVFKEEYRVFSDDVSKKMDNKKLLSDYIGELNKIITYFENELAEKGSKGMYLISSYSLTVDDFSNKMAGPAGYLYKLYNKKISEPGIRTREAVDSPEKWYTKASEIKEKIKEIFVNGLNSILTDIIDFFDKNYNYYKTAKTILSNMFTLGILSDLTKSISQYTNEKNLFLIDDSATFLNKIIDNNDTPFVYEKTGNYFHHFMIDEFQDTSGFQWNNFRPLISNSLSQHHYNMVVGDAKQAIYRWRNTDWEILSEKIHNEFVPGSIKTDPLEKNWRSRKKIIDFNNSFFTAAAKIMQDAFNNELDEISAYTQQKVEKFRSNIVDIYKDVCQLQAEPGNDEQGYIKIKFLEDQDINITGENLVNVLRELQDKGYLLKDIAVLTRMKKEGKDIADFLIEYKNNHRTEGKYRFDVISDESLYLSSSSVVNFIVAILKYFVNPGDTINNYFIAFEYLNYIKPSAGDNDISVPAKLPCSDKNSGDEFLPESVVKNLHGIRNLNIYEKVERLIETFHLSTIKGELPFIQAFQDLILEYSRKTPSNINAFLEYWKDTGSRQSISISEAQDAIRILTIHKSKGLEFKAVIIPYCNWNFDHTQKRPVLWCKPSKRPFNKLSVVPVNYSKELKNTIFADEYYTEKIKSCIDNLNLLYVAFTRASDAIYCFAGKENKKNNSIARVSDLLNKICCGDSKDNQPDKKSGKKLLFEEFYNKTHNTFEFGILVNAESGDSLVEYKVNSITEYPALDNRRKLRIAYQAGELFTADTEILTRPLSYGKLMHEIFSGIITTADVEPAIEKVYLEGKIGLTEKKLIHSEIKEILSNDLVRSWFSDKWKVITEKDIILPDSSVRRPDRVVLKDNNAVIIDYKFGEKELNEHSEQVKEYAQHLKEMGYDKIESFVWYINKGKIIKV